ncbi:hypothetical protein J4760_08615 [Salinicoccus sp. ID82-1]|uniref:Uncharacterized protein n=1 Tax=Salinicoccus cyprini TaxID=2493691 RepID=A0A558AWW4_9STAP|nr:MULTISPECIES: hypothetical protein [Salinicoccus]MCG1010082.1 hypothetical protein [Salinicoccus sp. ID82-1]TVT28755.1 hypothetical protein FO441_00300 [Salinicoccus cyprini]
MMEFLYFPEDKTEYIPALLVLGLTILLAYVVYRIFKRHSERQEEKMKDFEQQVMERIEREDRDGSRRP